ncbi:hypothetical protein J5N97_019281 [Dioscorea zingiberensis]|uniref:Uncharacterized protein n=1 Tax=Dioscorea zingiberensis TaxID=325984 RepID=A0A9D5CEQ7_9LILI|nr:hypothetical protein J5N97_019281 [Dioscorea zingiberensis]
MGRDNCDAWYIPSQSTLKKRGRPRKNTGQGSTTSSTQEASTCEHPVSTYSGVDRPVRIETSLPNKTSTLQSHSFSSAEKMATCSARGQGPPIPPSRSNNFKKVRQFLRLHVKMKMDQDT